MTATNYEHDGHNDDGSLIAYLGLCDRLLSSFVCLFISLIAYILITYATFVMLMVLDCLCMTLLDDEYINGIHVEIVFIHQKGLYKYIRSTA